MERLDDKTGIVGLCLQIQELIRGAGDAMSLAQVCFHSQLSFQLSVSIVGVGNDDGFHPSIGFIHN